ncbi:MAG: hypothetical protein ACRDP3_02805 [Streptomyces sp.]|uniref:hypothetical protein n=1 Tax=Streptomyces sp. TaxID=1931 RepID=UPI003D6C5DD7
MSGAGLSRSTVSAHRRSLTTATAAGAVLCALWFVPTAKATPDHSVPSAAASKHAGDGGHGTRTQTLTRDDGFGSTPYLVGGAGFAGAGGALLIRTRRRRRA